MSDLLDRILDAHGGAGHWGEVHAVLARASMGGVGFASRLQGQPLHEVEVTLNAAWPSITLADWPERGQSATCQPTRAWIERADGELVTERGAPGAAFRSLPHALWWDYLDLLYYCGNILWQTLCLPFTLAREGCALQELPPVDVGGQRLYRLAATYPADIPTLRTDHVFYADATGLLQRVDFAPRFTGSWMQATQLLEAYETVSVFNCATRYRVYPAMPGGRVVPLGPLSWIDVDDITFAWA